ncbi:MAG: hypothetical protein HYR56_28140 [Acidobacteria bacterium]|nr:hypothetical protein [Acidobacteriota bacterium]MBI3422508.1 hypothetical protein [Acidobacteriota bacterium]
MPELNQDEFYIGYLPRAPRGVAKLLRRVVTALFCGGVLVALVLAFGQQRLPLSVFEFQQYRAYTGVLHATPYPALLVQTGNSLTQYLLVAPGKHRAEVGAFDGQIVKLRAALIQRDGTQMLELAPDSLTVTAAASLPLPAKTELGTFTLVGEIVDSKCYLGVMNPGHTKPHRDCAVRCLSGGIPPLFIARDAQGNELKLLLTDAQGAPVNQAVLDMVAEPLEITGRVVREGTQYYLQADPPTYRRVR